MPAARVLSNPNLVVRVDGRLLRWSVAAPLLVSLLAFQRPPPKEVVMNLLLSDDAAAVKTPSTAAAKSSYSWRSFLGWSSTSASLPAKVVVAGMRGG